MKAPPPPLALAVALAMAMSACSGPIGNTVVPAGQSKSASCIPTPVTDSTGKRSAQDSCGAPGGDFTNYPSTAMVDDMTSFSENYMFNNMDSLTPGQELIPTDCQDWYYGPDPGDGTVGAGSTYLGTTCSMAEIPYFGGATEIGGIIVGIYGKTVPCNGSKYLPGGSIDNSNDPDSRVSDVDGVTVTLSVAGSPPLIEAIGWVYTTPSGQYFQLDGTISIGASGGLVFLSASVGVTPNNPIVPYNGNLTTAMNWTLDGLHFAGMGLPTPFNQLANATQVKVHIGSCYH